MWKPPSRVAPLHKPTSPVRTHPLTFPGMQRVHRALSTLSDAHKDATHNARTVKQRPPQAVALDVNRKTKRRQDRDRQAGETTQTDSACLQALLSVFVPHEKQSPKASFRQRAHKIMLKASWFAGTDPKPWERPPTDGPHCAKSLQGEAPYGVQYMARWINCSMPSPP